MPARGRALPGQGAEQRQRDPPVASSTFNKPCELEVAGQGHLGHPPPAQRRKPGWLGAYHALKAPPKETSSVFPRAEVWSATAVRPMATQASSNPTNVFESMDFTIFTKGRTIQPTFNRD